MVMIKAAAGVDCWGHGGSFILKGSKLLGSGRKQEATKGKSEIWAKVCYF